MDASAARHGCRSGCGDRTAARPTRADGTRQLPKLPVSGLRYPFFSSQYLIANLGMSTNFGFVDLENLSFPTKMKVDWIRVYQDPDSMNIGCDPPDFPTAAYIEESVRSLFVVQTLKLITLLATDTSKHTRTLTSRHGWMTLGSRFRRTAS